MTIFVAFICFFVFVFVFVFSNLFLIIIFLFVVLITLKLPSVISLAEILAALQADYRLCGLERSRGNRRFFCLLQFVYSYYKRCGAHIPVASQF